MKLIVGILLIFSVASHAFAITCTAKGSIEKEKYERPLAQDGKKSSLEFKGYTFEVTNVAGSKYIASIFNKKSLALTSTFSADQDSNYLTGKSMMNGDVVSLECKR